MTLIANNLRVYDAPGRVKCLEEHGGHHVYFNQEFGNLWCYNCGSSWKCNPPVSLKLWKKVSKWLANTKMISSLRSK